MPKYRNIRRKKRTFGGNQYTKNSNVVINETKTVVNNESDPVNIELNTVNTDQISTVNTVNDIDMIDVDNNNISTNEDDSSVSFEASFASSASFSKISIQCSNANRNRLKTAGIKNLVKSKKRRKVIRGNKKSKSDKNKTLEGKVYGSGDF